MSTHPLYDGPSAPSDLNLLLRGLLVTIVFVVLAALAVSNPTPWSALGGTGDTDTKRPVSTQLAEGQRTT